MAEQANRKPKQWTVPVIMAVLFVAGPLALNAVVPAGALGWTVVAFVAVVSVIGGLLDARLFRFNGTVVGVAVVAFFVSKVLYYNPGTWIYVVLVALLTLCGAVLGDVAGFKAAMEEDD